MTNNGSVGTRTSRILAFISNRWLNIADSSTLWYLIDRQHISSRNCSLSTTEYVLTWIGSFSSEEVLSLFFILIWISEINLNNRTVSSWIMKDSSDNSPNVALTFGVVEVAISCWCDTFAFGCSVYTALFTFPLAWVNDKFYIWWLCPWVVKIILIY